MKPRCTIGLVAYRRPLFLAECIRAMHRKPGMDFETLIWSNDVNNEGSYALKYLFERCTTEYFVVIEEDELWFQDDWLKDLVEAFEQKPGITPAGRRMGIKNEWGILATNTFEDEIDKYRGLIRFSKGRFIYWANIRAGGGAMIFRTEVLRKLDPFEPTKNKNGGLYPLLLAYERAKYPQGRIENIKIFHATSEDWNSLYPEAYLAKQGRLPNGHITEEVQAFLDNRFHEYITHRQ